MTAHDETHSTHEMVVGLHSRITVFQAGLDRVQETQLEHARALLDLQSRTTTVELRTVLERKADDATHDDFKAGIKELNSRFGTLFAAIAMTLLASVGGLSVLLYQTMAASRALGG